MELPEALRRLADEIIEELRDKTQIDFDGGDYIISPKGLAACLRRLAELLERE